MPSAIFNVYADDLPLIYQPALLYLIPDLNLYMHTLDERAQKVLWYIFDPKADKLSVSDIEIGTPHFRYLLHNPLVLQRASELTDKKYPVDDLQYIIEIRLFQNKKNSQNKFRTHGIHLRPLYKLI